MIRKAEKADVAAAAQSYQELFAYEAEHGSTTNWAAGIYPVESTAQAAFDADTLYVLEEDGRFCGSMIVNCVQPSEYAGIDWLYPAEGKAVLVGHTLCIPPSQAGKGYGRKMVEFILEESRRRGCKVVRLDTWAGNKPAANLYEHMGFRLAGTAPALLAGVISEQQIFFERKAAD